MGWENPPIPWAELERRMSGRSGNRPQPTGSHPLDRPEFVNCDGGDAPGWSRKRPAYETQPVPRPLAPVVDYAELHAHSDFCFLDGAIDPEDLVEEAVRLGLDGAGDHRSRRASTRRRGSPRPPTQYDAEHRLRRGTVARADRQPQNGVADPEGQHLLVLARRSRGLSPAGRGDHRRPAARAARRAARCTTWRSSPTSAGGHWLVLTGCRKGSVRQALVDRRPGRGARRARPAGRACSAPTTSSSS